MAKLLFKQNFVLEVGEDKFTGTLNDLTKAQKVTFNKANKAKKDEAKSLQKKVKEFKKVERKITIKENLEKWDEVETLEEQKDNLETEIEEMTEKLSDPKPIEDMFMKRLKSSIESDDFDEIMKAGADHGYQNVFETIQKDIEESQAKK